VQSRKIHVHVVGPKIFERKPRQNVVVIEYDTKGTGFWNGKLFLGKTKDKKI
jgi:hypothetical protein